MLQFFQDLSNVYMHKSGFSLWIFFYLGLSTHFPVSVVAYTLSSSSFSLLILWAFSQSFSADYGFPSSWPLQKNREPAQCLQVVVFLCFFLREVYSNRSYSTIAKTELFFFSFYIKKVYLYHEKKIATNVFL